MKNESVSNISNVSRSHAAIFILTVGGDPVGGASVGGDPCCQEKKRHSW